MDVFRIDDGNEGGTEPLGEAAPGPEEPEPGRLGALVSDHPLAVLGGALALGYIVGGGLGSPLARRVLRAGVRLGFQLAVLPDFEEDVAGLASRLGQTLRDVADASAGASRPTNGTGQEMPRDS